jgi:hypothetical protein
VAPHPFHHHSEVLKGGGSIRSCLRGTLPAWEETARSDAPISASTTGNRTWCGPCPRCGWRWCSYLHSRVLRSRCTGNFTVHSQPTTLTRLVPEGRDLFFFFFFFAQVIQRWTPYRPSQGYPHPSAPYRASSSVIGGLDPWPPRCITGWSPTGLPRRRRPYIIHTRTRRGVQPIKSCNYLYEYSYPHQRCPQCNGQRGIRRCGHALGSHWRPGLPNCFSQAPIQVPDSFNDRLCRWSVSVRKRRGTHDTT